MSGRKMTDFQSSVLNYLKTLTQGQKSIMATLADLKTQVVALATKVAAETTVETSIETLLTSVAASQKDLAAQLAAALANNDPAAMQEVSDSLTASSTALDANIANLTAAVTANTTS